MAHKAEWWDWVEGWMRKHFSADCLNQKFHDDFHERFPEYKRSETNWGAQCVAQAQRDLAEMARSGILEKGRVGLGVNWEPGLPKSVVGYTLPEVRRT